MQIALRKYEALESPTIPRLTRRQIRFWCRVFSVREPAKHRRRHICEPLINDFFIDTPTVHFTSRAQRHAALANFIGGYAVPLDFASFYDQFGLDGNVRQFFGVKTAVGSTRMAVLPMGFRPAAAVAQAATWCVVDVAGGLHGRLRPGVDYTILTYIDNILIVAHSRENARLVAGLITERAASVGLKFNDEPVPKPDNWSPEPAPAVEFLGEYFDLHAGNVRQGPKTIQKIRSVDANCWFPEHSPAPQMTKRELAAVIGLFLFASGCCETFGRIHNYYFALRFFRDQVSWRCDRPPDWDSIIDPIPRTAVNAFREWALDLSKNEPRSLANRVDKCGKEPTDMLFVDASEERWGAIHLHGTTIRVLAGSWTLADRQQWDLSSSVAAEPLGMRRAICMAISPTPTTSVAVFTDHQPLIAATEAPCAKAFAYWHLQRFLRNFPAPITLHHIEGTMNPADAFTRGPMASPHDPAWARVLGDALTYACMQTHKVEDDGANGGQAEWACTARNPTRRLCRGFSVA